MAKIHINSFLERLPYVNYIIPEMQKYLEQAPCKIKFIKKIPYAKAVYLVV